jgi:hypothetical protein
LAEAFGLWRGPPLADQPRGARLGARLTEARLSAMEAYVDVALRLDRHWELLGELTELVTGIPCTRVW